MKWLQRKTASIPRISFKISTVLCAPDRLFLHRNSNPESFANKSFSSLISKKKFLSTKATVNFLSAKCYRRRRRYQQMPAFRKIRFLFGRIISSRKWNLLFRSKDLCLNFGILVFIGNNLVFLFVSKYFIKNANTQKSVVFVRIYLTIT